LYVLLSPELDVDVFSSMSLPGGANVTPRFAEFAAVVDEVVRECRPDEADFACPNGDGVMAPRVAVLLLRVARELGRLRLRLLLRLWLLSRDMLVAGGGREFRIRSCRKCLKKIHPNNMKSTTIGTITPISIFVGVARPESAEATLDVELPELPVAVAVVLLGGVADGATVKSRFC
jgi:hypothetical protein